MVGTGARSLAATIAGSAPFDVALRLLEAVDSGRSSHLGVLTYHRIGDGAATSDGLYPGLVSASREEFEAQVGFLARRYRVISLEQLLNARRGEPLPPRSVMLTFDDAYADFADLAWPALRSRAVDATLFVPTGYPGGATGFWWDWMHAAVQAAPEGMVLRAGELGLRVSDPASRADAFRALRTLVKGQEHDAGMSIVADVAAQAGVPAPPSPVLGWDALRALAAEGVAIAAHSRGHPLLTRVDRSQLREELRGSLDDVRREIGSVLPVTAYPSGAVNDDVVEAAREVGYEVGLTTDRGTNNLDHADWLRLRRINVGARTSLNLLRAQIGRWAGVWSR
jgi:peptidoglycan/xylan/chitin deacetylase (PgdA/CDA1 family)